MLVTVTLKSQITPNDTNTKSHQSGEYPTTKETQPKEAKSTNASCSSPYWQKRKRKKERDVVSSFRSADLVLLILWLKVPTLTVQQMIPTPKSLGSGSSGAIKCHAVFCTISSLSRFAQTNAISGLVSILIPFYSQKSQRQRIQKCSLEQFYILTVEGPDRRTASDGQSIGRDTAWFVNALTHLCPPVILQVKNSSHSFIFHGCHLLQNSFRQSCLYTSRWVRNKLQ